MKKVKCTYSECGKHRDKDTHPHLDYFGPRIIEVSDNYEGPHYCSITCAVLDGSMTLRFPEQHGW